MNWNREADRLERLAFDLRLIGSNGERPTIDQMLSAPILSEWRKAPSLITVLTGVANGHPRLGSGPVTTSMVFAQGEGWVRTLSRFYQLQDPQR
ncbi:DUF6634 family protein [Hansschlegelia zhihuaiae]|uniref:Uncharacterized protein n=1 Tax=Hansschlegelia zhihuaiae TaxID=405005 RepID=A0A4Q0M4S7_9HYPH|nr:DUF6634 family protein [Hansschlegelia zhihuaiae]RXF67957.1 hypothetical protein EK403_20755 [Hansschlegelia zhihuaiae]